MSDVINLLPDSIANQIAAGEVVQRPASVVKEMLENSIDAGAQNIQLIVKEAGKSLLQIIDDGCGMSVTDARMSFERHATSKIRTSEDLFKIRTMGFRGEALASIAAVAQVELKTKREEDELGTKLIIESSEIKTQEPVNTPKGTSISVKNLFYNVPARRNFLKSNPVEKRHINDEFQRVALANPQVGFVMKQEEHEVRLEAGKLSKRIVQLFGKNYQKQLIPCSEETPHVKISGYVGKPENAKKTRGEQFFFINDRFIKSSYLNHAVTTAFEGLITDKHFPFYVLKIEIDPIHVDINVHPTKTEVKFDDDRLLYSVVKAAVRQALASFNVAPSLDFSVDVSFDHLSKKREERITTSDRNYGSFKSFQQSDSLRLEKLNELYQGVRQEELTVIQQAEQERFPEPTIPSLPQQSAISFTKNEEKEPYLLHEKYLIRQVKSGFTVIDIEAALERIMFEDYQRRISTKKGVSQSCLFPQQITFNQTDIQIVKELEEEINNLGFEFEMVGENRVVIQGIPAEMVSYNEKEIFEGLIEQYKYNVDALNLPKKESVARAIAKRTSREKKLQKEELDALIDRLFACSQPNYTPDGRPTYVIQSMEQIASWFVK